MIGTKFTTEDFYNKYNGKRFFDVDGAGSDSTLIECADLAKVAINEIYGEDWMAFGGYPDKDGGVKNAFYNFPNSLITTGNWEKIPNTPSFVPKRGDIIIFDGLHGHIGVVWSADTRFVSVFNTNWTGKNAIINNFNYVAPKCLGVLRHKFIDPNLRLVEPTPQPVLPTVEYKENPLNVELQKQKEELERKLSEEVATNNEIQDEIDKLKEQFDLLKINNENLKNIINQPKNELTTTMQNNSYSLAQQLLHTDDKTAKNAVITTTQNLLPFVSRIVTKLTSSRLWVALGGTYAASLVDNDLYTLTVAVVLGGLYIISSTIGYVTDNNRKK